MTKAQIKKKVTNKLKDLGIEGTLHLHIIKYDCWNIDTWTQICTVSVQVSGHHWQVSSEPDLDAVVAQVLGLMDGESKNV